MNVMVVDDQSCESAVSGIIRKVRVVDDYLVVMLKMDDDVPEPFMVVKTPLTDVNSVQ